MLGKGVEASGPPAAPYIGGLRIGPNEPPRSKRQGITSVIDFSTK